MDGTAEPIWLWRQNLGVMDKIYVFMDRIFVFKDRIYVFMEQNLCVYGTESMCLWNIIYVLVDRMYVCNKVETPEPMYLLT